MTALGLGNTCAICGVRTVQEEICELCGLRAQLKATTADLTKARAEIARQEEAIKIMDETIKNITQHFDEWGDCV